MTRIGYISKEQFENNPELKAKYGSYENYMETQLRTMSTFTYAKNNPVANPAESFYSLRCEAYDKHNARSDELIANYKMLEAQYKALLVEQSSINNSLYSKYGVSSSGDLLTAMNDKNALYDQGLFNKTSKSVSDAYRAFISALQTANYHTHRIV